MHDLVERLRKRAEIRRSITTRKSVQEGQPDRIADLLDEAADEIEHQRGIIAMIEFKIMLAEKRKTFCEKFKDVAEGSKIFDVLFDTRGFLMAARSDFPIDIAPEDSDIDTMIAIVEEYVGPSN